MAREPQTPAHTAQVDLGSADLARLVAGPVDSYLALIEQAFEVECEARGQIVLIKGAPEATRSAELALAELGRRAKAAGRLDEADVRAAIAHAPRAGEQSSEGGGPLRLGSVIAKTPGQARFIEALVRDDLVFGIGPAGTGKTYLAVAAAVEALRVGEVERIVVTRPAVEAGERLGFLPGDFGEKVDPYYQPIWDSLHELMGREKVEKRRERGIIEVAPVAFMRGRTLKNCFALFDEAQNATRMQMRMMLTRLGEGSRMIVTGDPVQTDLPTRADSGLMHAVRLVHDLPGVGVVEFTSEDVVRRHLVSRIVERYERDDARSDRP